MTRRIAFALAWMLAIAACSAQTATPAATATTSATTLSPSQAGVPTQSPSAVMTPTAVVTPATSGPAIHQVGDIVTVSQGGKDWAKITISDVQSAASYKGSSGLSDVPLIAGDVFVSAKVSYEALVDGVTYNPYDWQVFVGGKKDNNFLMAAEGPKPDLLVGTLAAGQKTSGYVVWEVPANGEVQLIYAGAYTGHVLTTPPVFQVIVRAA